MNIDLCKTDEVNEPLERVILTLRIFGIKFVCSRSVGMAVIQSRTQGLLYCPAALPLRKGPGCGWSRAP